MGPRVQIGRSSDENSTTFGGWCCLPTARKWWWGFIIPPLPIVVFGYLWIFILHICNLWCWNMHINMAIPYTIHGAYGLWTVDSPILINILQSSSRSFGLSMHFYATWLPEAHFFPKFCGAQVSSVTWWASKPARRQNKKTPLHWSLRLRGPQILDDFSMF